METKGEIVDTEKTNLKINHDDAAIGLELTMGDVMFLHQALPRINGGLALRPARKLMDKLDDTILEYDKSKNGEADAGAKT